MVLNSPNWSSAGFQHQPFIHQQVLYDPTTGSSFPLIAASHFSWRKMDFFHLKRGLKLCFWSKIMSQQWCPGSFSWQCFTLESWDVIGDYLMQNWSKHIAKHGKKVEWYTQEVEKKQLYPLVIRESSTWIILKTSHFVCFGRLDVQDILLFGFQIYTYPNSKRPFLHWCSVKHLFFK